MLTRLRGRCRVFFSPWLSKLSSVSPSSLLPLWNCFLPPPLHTFLPRVSCSPPIWRVAKTPSSPPGGAGSSPLGRLPQTWNNRPILSKLSQTPPARSPTPQRPTPCQRFSLKSSQPPPVPTRLSSSATLARLLFTWPLSRPRARGGDGGAGLRDG